MVGMLHRGGGCERRRGDARVHFGWQVALVLHPGGLGAFLTSRARLYLHITFVPASVCVPAPPGVFSCLFTGICQYFHPGESRLFHVFHQGRRPALLLQRLIA
jgi:hypothetical protein